MAKIPMYDPLTSEVQSPLVAGLTEAMSNLSATLDMNTETIEDYQLDEVYISATDRFRIYQVPLSKKLWLESPEPVFKRNGTVITPSDDAFKVDYIGGSITFYGINDRTKDDVFTVSCTHVVDSNKLKEQMEEATTKLEAAIVAADEAVTAADKAEQMAAKAGWFELTDEDGYLVEYRTNNANVDFADNNGVLEVIYE